MSRHDNNTQTKARCVLTNSVAKFVQTGKSVSISKYWGNLCELTRLEAEYDGLELSCQHRMCQEENVLGSARDCGAIVDHVVVRYTMALVPSLEI